MPDLKVLPEPLQARFVQSMPQLPDNITDEQPYLKSALLAYQRVPDLPYCLRQSGGWDGCSASELGRAVANISSKEEIKLYLLSVNAVYSDQAKVRETQAKAISLASELYASDEITSLTPDQQLFIYNYRGDVGAALEACGLINSRVNRMEMLASQLLRDLKGRIDAILFVGEVASTVEIRAILSSLARDEQLKPSDRLSASKLLLQAEGELSGVDKEATAITVNIANIIE